jgi:hypothetical protein
MGSPGKPASESESSAISIHSLSGADDQTFAGGLDDLTGDFVMVTNNRSNMMTFTREGFSLTMGHCSMKAWNIKQIMFLTMPARETQDWLTKKGVKAM